MHAVCVHMNKLYSILAQCVYICVLICCDVDRSAGTFGVINQSHSTKCITNCETHPLVAVEESDSKGGSEELLK